MKMLVWLISPDHMTSDNPHVSIQVTALENELDAAHAALKDATSSHKGTSSEPTTGTGAGEAAAALEAAEHQRARLAQQNEELQAKVSNLQAQVCCLKAFCWLERHL